jgi:hypothetical protein
VAREGFEQRAAIVKYEAGLSGAAAEEQGLDQLLEDEIRAMSAA